MTPILSFLGERVVGFMGKADKAGPRRGASNAGDDIKGPAPGSSAANPTAPYLCVLDHP